MWRIFPCDDQFGERADGFFDGCLRVDAVLVVEVDVVGAEAPERTFDRGANVRRTAVEIARTRAGVGDETEFRREHDVVTTVLDGFADELLVGEGAIDLRGVDQRHAEIERAMNGADGLGVVGTRSGVRGRHPHRAETDTGDIERPEVDVLHRYFSSLGWVVRGRPF